MAIDTVIPTYEQRLRQDRKWAMDEGDRHFARENQVFKTMRRIANRLQDMGILYAIVGGMALNAYDYQRLTVGVELLVTPESLKSIHEKLEGLGYLPPFLGRNQRRDTEHGFRIEFLITGEFPGDGKPKPLAFPDPTEASTVIDGLTYLKLPQLVELKLASGMTGGVARLRDLADVVSLIQIVSLVSAFADQLDGYVRSKYLELWGGLQDSPTGPDAD